AVLLSLRPIEYRRAGGRLCDSRARSRTRARRNPRGPLCAESSQPASAAAHARPSAVDPGARRRDRRGLPSRAGIRALGLVRELLTDLPLTRAPDGRCGNRYVPGRDPVRLEEDDVVRVLTPRQLTGHDLVQFVHLEPVENTLPDGLDQVRRLDLRLFEPVAADERRSGQHDVVELA